MQRSTLNRGVLCMYYYVQVQLSEE